ncbi:peptide-methionine (S)-S-oxide reductase MsrA [Candidatus Micrarchaeota archaeon]|nr:peptide-methionine (S)-S-oxide reductase MsrA [Candidatus Micrarchaeota archaeon]
MSGKTETIVFGGGCFWCTEAVFRLFKGITRTTVGYSGGKSLNPTYEQICNGNSDHIEVMELEFDPSKIALEKLLDIFFTMHDPTSMDRQGADAGIQYRSVIFYTSEDQKKSCVDFIKKIQKDYDKPIVTEVKTLDKFYTGEEYHQNYYERNSNQPYCSVVIGQKIQKVKKKYGLS